MAIALVACATNGEREVHALSATEPTDGDGGATDATAAGVDSGDAAALPSGGDAGRGGDGGVDAAPDAPAPVVACNGAACPVGAQICCRFATPFGYSYSCAASQSCTGASYTVIPCDDANDCAAQGSPGAVCCAQIGSSGVAIAVTCVAPASCTSSDSVRLCDPYDFSSCPAGLRCKLPTLAPVPGVFVCLPN